MKRSTPAWTLTRQTPPRRSRRDTLANKLRSIMRYRGTRNIPLDSDQEVSRVIRYIADGLREKAKNVTVEGTLIKFCGVHERDAGNKMALFTSGSAGEVKVDRTSNMIHFELSLNDRIKGAALVAGVLNVIGHYNLWIDAKPKDLEFNIYMSIALLCFCLFFIGIVTLSYIIQFNLFLNGRLGDAEFARK